MLENQTSNSAVQPADIALTERTAIPQLGFGVCRSTMTRSARLSPMP